MRVEIGAAWDRVRKELTAMIKNSLYVFFKTEQNCKYRKVKFKLLVCAVSLLK